MALTIKNLGRGRPFNLKHDGLRDMGPPFGYGVHAGATVDEDSATGVRRPRVVRKALPAVLTFLAGETKSGLPNMIKDCPEIAAGLAPGGGLRLIAETPDVPPTEPKPATSIVPNTDVLTPVPTDPFVQIHEPPPAPKPARGGPRTP
jgi:hypothetical protein